MALGGTGGGACRDNIPGLRRRWEGSTEWSEEVSATVRGLIRWYDTVQRSPATPSARPQCDVAEGHLYLLEAISGDQALLV